MRKYDDTQERCGQIFGSDIGGKIFEPRTDQVLEDVLKGPDHVILKGRQVKNLVLKFEYLLFFNRCQVLKLGAPSRYYKGAFTKKD